MPLTMGPALGLGSVVPPSTPCRPLPDRSTCTPLPPSAMFKTQPRGERHGSRMKACISETVSISVLCMSHATLSLYGVSPFWRLPILVANPLVSASGVPEPTLCVS